VGLNKSHNYFPPVTVQSIVISMSLCMSAHISRKPNFMKFSVHVKYGRGSVLSWWQWLC